MYIIIFVTIWLCIIIYNIILLYNSVISAGNFFTVRVNVSTYVFITCPFGSNFLDQTCTNTTNTVKHYNIITRQYETPFETL